MPDEFFQNLHDRISYRAKWHNYNCGMYFVTICTKDREHYFGEITDGEMNLSEIGKCLQEQIVKTPEMRADMNMEIPLFVIMPDHVHLIVTIGENQYNTSVRGGATHFDDATHCDDTMHCRGAMHCAPTNGTTNGETNHCAPTDGEQMNKFSPQSKNLASVIRGIKISTTTFARKNQIPFSWQRSFHDRIIRDTAEMNRIAEYIENNVAEWDSEMKNT
jgi:REP element-mobilizing transposase RayT